MFYTEGQFVVKLLSPIFRKAAPASCPVAEEAVVDEDAAVLDPVYKRIRKLLRHRNASQFGLVYSEIITHVVDFTYFDVRPAFQQKLPEILRSCLQFRPGVTDELVRVAVSSIRYTSAMDEELTVMYEKMNRDDRVREEKCKRRQFVNLYRYKLIVPYERSTSTACLWRRNVIRRPTNSSFSPNGFGTYPAGRAVLPCQYSTC
jgi:hypothetical protein